MSKQNESKARVHSTGKVEKNESKARVHSIGKVEQNESKPVEYTILVKKKRMTSEGVDIRFKNTDVSSRVCTVYFMRPLLICQLFISLDIFDA